MFCFRLWGRFGVFRDPLTITQNITFAFPPKTTVGGMLASILGIDYDDYFSDESYFNFKYSAIILNPIRKKNFSQNYVADYTQKAEMKLQKIKKAIILNKKISDLTAHKNNFMDSDELSPKERKKLKAIEKKLEDNKNKQPKVIQQFHDAVSLLFSSPKPTSRELLINPAYLIFIKDFKFEDKIIPFLQNHFSAFYLYMGNSEFAANYKYTPIGYRKQSIETLHSFTENPHNILFESDKKYTNTYMATKTVEHRQYRDYKNIIYCDNEIKLKQPIESYSISNSNKVYNCEFI